MEEYDKKKRIAMSKVILSETRAIDIDTHINTGSLYDTKVHEGYRAVRESFEVFVEEE